MGIEHWTDFEKVYVGTALGMLVLSIVGGVITLKLLDFFERRYFPEDRKDG